MDLPKAGSDAVNPNAHTHTETELLGLGFRAAFVGCSALGPGVDYMFFLARGWFSTSPSLHIGRETLVLGVGGCITGIGGLGLLPKPWGPATSHLSDLHTEGLAN